MDFVRTLFITGTDTGVGKTLLTALLLSHLRQSGCHALALKPFCSGGRADAELLYQLQDGELDLDEINPFYFPEPVAPLVAARKHRRRIPLQDVLRHIRQLGESMNPSIHTSTNPPPTLLIEGSGGLLVPLGEGYTVLDLLTPLSCETIVVSRNQLGTINHTLLTARCLQGPNAVPRAPRSTLHALPARPLSPKVVLMNLRGADYSSQSNARILSEWLAPIPLVTIPFLGPRASSAAKVRSNAKRLIKPLAQILEKK